MIQQYRPMLKYASSQKMHLENIGPFLRACSIFFLSICYYEITLEKFAFTWQHPFLENDNYNDDDNEDDDNDNEYIIQKSLRYEEVPMI